jgi:hypothetical protein
MSADRAGVDLVPLFEVMPSAVSSGFAWPVFQSHLLIWFLSSSSRRSSPSHQTAKFTWRGCFTPSTILPWAV